MTPQEQFEHDNAQRKLIQYPLDSASVVFDVGGYLGEWTNELLTARDHGVCKHCGGRQNPYVFIFEPIGEFADQCTLRFTDYPKVRVIPTTLGNRRRIITMNEDKSATSPFSPLLNPREVEVQDIDSFVNARGIKRIEVISINIEGMEYELLNRMVETGIAAMCQNIQVQFHQGLHAARQREKIQERLRETHEQAWCYEFVWEKLAKETWLS